MAADLEEPTVGEGDKHEPCVMRGLRDVCTGLQGNKKRWVWWGRGDRLTSHPGTESVDSSPKPAQLAVASHRVVASVTRSPQWWTAVRDHGRMRAPAGDAQASCCSMNGTQTPAVTFDLLTHKRPPLDSLVL